MAQQVKAGGYIYRINPSNDRELQRCSIGAPSWSRVCDFNGNHILDLMLASNGKDIEVYTDRYVYVKMYSGARRVIARSCAGCSMPMPVMDSARNL